MPRSSACAASTSLTPSGNDPWPSRHMHTRLRPPFAASPPRFDDDSSPLGTPAGTPAGELLLQLALGPLRPAKALPSTNFSSGASVAQGTRTEVPCCCFSCTAISPPTRQASSSDTLTSLFTPASRQQSTQATRHSSISRGTVNSAPKWPPAQACFNSTTPGCRSRAATKSATVSAASTSSPPAPRGRHCGLGATGRVTTVGCTGTTGLKAA
mmetsp:Transcript_1468/g.3074  ORF Transcript_1468/g.3074 Transcript_1468/m.3074 type:complete len:212 (-) Transcript_1468:48-683(-)